MINTVVKTPHGNYTLRRNIDKIVAITVAKVKAELTHHKERFFPGDKLHIEHTNGVPRTRKQIAVSLYGWATPLATYTIDGKLVEWEDAPSVGTSNELR